MRMRRHARRIVALAAAYAVAAQAILLGVGGPLAGVADLAAQPICSPAAAGEHYPAPAGHGHGCLGACLACCCAANAAPTPATAVVYALGPARGIAAAAEIGPEPRLSFTRAHRSRAPPLD